MATRKQRRGSQQGPARSAPEPEVVDLGDGPESPAGHFQGVMIPVERSEDGSLSTQVAPVGVSLAEVPTILELALAGYRERIGLPRLK